MPLQAHLDPLELDRDGLRRRHLEKVSADTIRAAMEQNALGALAAQGDQISRQLNFDEMGNEIRASISGEHQQTSAVASASGQTAFITEGEIEQCVLTQRERALKEEIER